MQVAQDIIVKVIDSSSPTAPPRPGVPGLPATGVGEFMQSQVNLLGRTAPLWAILLALAVMALAVLVALFWTRRYLRRLGLSHAKRRDKMNRGGRNVSRQMRLAKKHQHEPSTEVIDLDQLIKRHRIQRIILQVIPAFCLPVMALGGLYMILPASYAVPSASNITVLGGDGTAGGNGGDGGAGQSADSFATMTGGVVVDHSANVGTLGAEGAAGVDGADNLQTIADDVLGEVTVMGGRGGDGGNGGSGGDGGSATIDAFCYGANSAFAADGGGGGDGNDGGLGGAAALFLTAETVRAGNILVAAPPMGAPGDGGNGGDSGSVYENCVGGPGPGNIASQGYAVAAGSPGSAGSLGGYNQHGQQLLGQGGAGGGGTFWDSTGQTWYDGTQTPFLSGAQGASGSGGNGGEGGRGGCGRNPEINNVQGNSRLIVPGTLVASSITASGQTHGIDGATPATMSCGAVTILINRLIVEEATDIYLSGSISNDEGSLFMLGTVDVQDGATLNIHIEDELHTTLRIMQLKVCDGTYTVNYPDNVEVVNRVCLKAEETDPAVILLESGQQLVSFDTEVFLNNDACTGLETLQISMQGEQTSLLLDGTDHDHQIPGLEYTGFWDPQTWPGNPAWGYSLDGGATWNGVQDYDNPNGVVALDELANYIECSDMPCTWSVRFGFMAGPNQALGTYRGTILWRTPGWVGDLTGGGSGNSCAL